MLQVTTIMECSKSIFTVDLYLRWFAFCVSALELNIAALCKLVFVLRGVLSCVALG